MGVFLVFIWNIVVFILSIVLRLALYSAKLTLALIKVPADYTLAKASSALRSKKTNGVIKTSSLVAFVSLKSLVALLNLLIIVVDIFLVFLSSVGLVLGLVVSLLVIVVIFAGAYIIILNDCSVGSGGTSSADTKTVSSEKKVGSSETAGMGQLTEEAKNWAKSWQVTYIGDSLGAGSEANFTSAFPNAEYHSDPSRGLISIRGQQTGETAIATLKRLASEGKVKENLVVAIGTNNDISTEALQEFYNEIPSSVKTITWVLTASEGGVDNGSINSTVKNFVNSHDNMRYLDWKTYVDNNGGWGSYQGGDNIHMSAEGYEKYVNFQIQGLYDLYGGGSSSKKSNSVAAGGGDFLGRLYGVAERTVFQAVDTHIYAEESKKDKKKGCNYSTTKVSDGSKKSESGSAGGKLQQDGTGSHGQQLSGWGIAYAPEELPDELKKYAINPESVGMQYGAAWSEAISAPNAGGWIDFIGSPYSGQCTELSASLLYQLWEKDGQHFANAQGNGDQVAGIVASKLGISVKNSPTTGAVFSASYQHVGIVSHVFENGDILVIEQNTPKSGQSIGKPNTWNYRLIPKASFGNDCGNGFVNPADAGYSIVGNVSTVG